MLNFGLVIFLFKIYKKKNYKRKVNNPQNAEFWACNFSFINL